MRLNRETLLAGLFALAISATCPMSTRAQHHDIIRNQPGYEAPTDPLVLENLAQWKKMKFGVIFHWGIYSLIGSQESWVLCNDNWVKRDTTLNYTDYKKWYWNLASVMNPQHFEPKRWANIMDDAGMKYMVFTTKHHDGFCMYDTHETNYSIAKYGPFSQNPKRDVARHVFDAFRDRGFMVGAYYSKPDWHSQDYWWDRYATTNRDCNYNTAVHPERWNRFKGFVHRQVDELTSRYGRVDLLWFDGSWCKPIPGAVKQNGWVDGSYHNVRPSQDLDMASVARIARKNQPGIIMVDRTPGEHFENYKTPERMIPKKQLSYPWETCTTLTQAWNWVPNPIYKTPQQVLQMLIEVVAKGGNLLLGVGPTADGVIEPQAIEVLHQVGEWLRQNGRAIYDSEIVPTYHIGNVWFTTNAAHDRLFALCTPQEGESLPKTIEWTGQVPEPGSQIRLVSNGRRLHWRVVDGTVHVDLGRHVDRTMPVALEIRK